MTCQACDTARANPLSGLFHADCDGCAARALAVCQPFHESEKLGWLTTEYRAALEKMLPQLPANEAHAMVKEWARPGSKRNVRRVVPATVDKGVVTC